MGTLLNGYLVLQGNTPFIPSQFKHFLNNCSQDKCQVPVGPSTRLAGADPIYLSVYLYNNYTTTTTTNNNNDNTNTNTNCRLAK